MATFVLRKHRSFLTLAARRYISTSPYPFSTASAPSTPPAQKCPSLKQRSKVASKSKHPGPLTPLSKLGQSRASRYAEAAAQRAAVDSDEERREQTMKLKKEKKKKKETPRFAPLTESQPAHSDLPFAFRYSYTEVPKVQPIGFREKYSPFGPGRLDRPWDGQKALPVETSSATGKPKLERKRHVIDSFNPPTKKGMKPIAPPGPFLPDTGPKKAKTREEILGESLTKEETDMLMRESMRSKKQLNMGRDGLTHNLLISLYDYWTRERMVRVKCMGVATVDMDNMVSEIEDKSGGKVIYRAGGTLHVFRGRYYNNKNRPNIPRMLWRPHSPIYPKLVTEAPEGLTRQAANALRKCGRELLPLCRLAKNGFYGDLVEMIREAFQEENLVRIDCKVVNRPDYKKIGAKLRDLVPCVILSFQEDQILLWKGKQNRHKGKKELSQEDVDIKHLDKPGTMEEQQVDVEGTMAVSHDGIENASHHYTSSDENSSEENEDCYEFDDQSDSRDEETNDAGHETNDDVSDKETDDDIDGYGTFDDEDDTSVEETQNYRNLCEPHNEADDEYDSFDEETQASNHLHQDSDQGIDDADEEENQYASHGYETVDEDDCPHKDNGRGCRTAFMISDGLD